MANVIGTEETMLVEEILEITAADHAVTVLSDDDYEMAGDFLTELKHKEKQAREFFGPMVAAAHQAHKAVKARENEVIKPLVEAKKSVGLEMGRYRAEKEVEARKERERLQAEADEARRKEEAEAAEAAAKLEAEAEAARKREAELAKAAAALEAAGKAEEAQKVEAERVTAAAEADRKLDEAIVVLEDDDAAQEEAANLPVAEEPATPKVVGTSYRATWKFEIVDASLIPQEYMVVDERKISGVVRSMKEKASIPGVRVYSTNSVS